MIGRERLRQATVLNPAREHRGTTCEIVGSALRHFPVNRIGFNRGRLGALCSFERDRDQGSCNALPSIAPSHKEA